MVPGLAEVNVSKTKVVSFTTKQTPITNHYTLNEKQVENVSNFKYLGVHLTSDLSWNLHIDTVTSNAYKTLGFIRRNLHFANSDTQLLAYNTLVRSKLDYASQIWNPHQAYLINKIESLQNKSARFITKIYSRTSSINEIKKSLKLPSLQSRRLFSLLSLFHNLYHNDSQLSALIKPAHRIFARLDHEFKLEPLFARTNLFLHSPLVLAVSHWNQLPGDIVCIKNHEEFTHKLKLHLGV